MQVIGILHGKRDVMRSFKVNAPVSSHAACQGVRGKSNAHPKFGKVETKNLKALELAALRHIEQL